MVVATLKATLGKRALPLRFAAAGAVNTVVGLSVYPLLLWTFGPWGLHYKVALVISQVICICLAFLTMRRAFRSRGDNLRAFFKFSGFYLLCAAFNFAALGFLVEDMHARPIPAQLALSALIMATSYFWHSRITFKPTSPRT